MLFAIMRLELLNNLRNRRTLIGTSSIVVLVLLSFHVGYESYCRRLTDYNQGLASNAAILRRNRSYTDLISGFQVNRRPNPLSIVASGLDGRIGTVAQIQRDELPDLQRTRAEDNPAFDVFGDLDVEFVVRVLLSLFAIAFSYDLVTHERESGTLKLILANSVPRDRIILGKLCGAAVNLVLPFLIAYSLGLAYVAARGVALTADQWARVWLCCVHFVVYMLLFLMLGVFISAIAKNARHSAFALLTLWSLLVLVVPAASPALSEALVGRASGHELGYQNMLVRVEVYNDRDTRSHSMFEINRWIYQEITARMHGYLMDFLNRRDRSVRLGKAISRLSPACALVYVTTSLAGTGIEDASVFERDLWQYRRAFLDSMYQQAAEHEGEVDTRALPSWTPRERRLAEMVGECWPHTALMAGGLVLVFLAAHLSFLRRQVIT